MTTEIPLHIRIEVDENLFLDVARALLAMRRGMYDNKAPLTPRRRTDLMAVLELLQGEYEWMPPGMD
jgi:hypothetical protein